MSAKKNRQDKLVIISLGGSVVAPDGIETEFLKKFDVLIRGFVKRGMKFVIVVGGGRICRHYQNAAEKVIGKVTDEDKDWLGIHATRLNAQLLRTIFKDIANPILFDNAQKFSQLDYPVTIGSGWKPGWSTDYVTASIAVEFGAKTIINAGKPTHVFDKDPHIHADAKKFSELTWREYRNLIPKKWSPGLSSPIDPVAAKLCEERGIKAAVVNGADLPNFRRAIFGQKFVGTVIS